MSECGSWTDEFPGNFQWSNATLVVKGMAPYGVVGLADIQEVCNRLRLRQNESNAWCEEWTSIGAIMEQRAITEEAMGHYATAGDLFMRAGNYLYTAERFIHPGPDKRAAAERAYRAFHRGIRLRYPEIEFLEIPYEQTSLPALFVPARGVDGPAPTVVIVNGMDNAKEMSAIFAGLEFARRGINCLALDGPGQGEARRLRDICSRYDYEVAGTAAFDLLAARLDVDSKRIAIMGYSFGGFYSSRIAAFEPRYSAAVAMTAPHWDLAAWQLALKKKQEAKPNASAQSNFQFQWVVGANDAEDAIEVARKFSLSECAGRIRCPFLITHGAEDRVIPAENAEKLFNAVGTQQKTMIIIGPEEPGSQHAHVDDRQKGVNLVADWLEQHL
jgi:dienelactone hydrolase